MASRYPGTLDEAVANWITEHAPGSLRDDVANMQACYKRGGQSRGLNLSAYLTTRLPATYAVNLAVTTELRDLMPEFTPSHVVDVGAGPGTAGWAALATWPETARITQVELAADLAALAKALNAASGMPALQNATLRHCEVGEWQDAGSADLVIASYVLAEIDRTRVNPIIRHLWRGTTQVLVLIEPGTPEGFARLKTARDMLLRDGANIVAPCTHDKTCPLAEKDWCHFKQRVQRSRAHMQAKGAVVPFEDEAYAYLIVARSPVARHQARVIMPVTTSKGGMDLTLCTDGARRLHHVATRDKATYKRLRKAEWGDAVDIEDAT